MSDAITEIANKTISINDCTVQVAECGNGYPILMVPDNLAGIAFSFRHLQRLLPNRRTIALDFPGTGGSDKNPAYEQSLTNLAEVVMQAADGLELTSFDLLSFGRGSGIARMIAIDEPDRVRSLSMMGSIAYDNWPILEMEFAATLQAHMEQARPMMPVQK